MTASNESVAFHKPAHEQAADTFAMWVFMGSGARRVIGHGSVALVALLEPGIAAVVVAVSAPRIRARRGRAAAGRPPTSRSSRSRGAERAGAPAPRAATRQRLAVEVPHDPRLAAGHVGERQVRGVARVREREHVRRGRQRAGRVEQRVDGNAREGHAELRPRRHAVDVAGVRRRRQRVDLVPGPRRRAARRARRPERPRRGVEARRDLRGEYRPAVPVSYWPGGSRASRRAATAGEASRESRHGYSLPCFR